MRQLLLEATSEVAAGRMPRGTDPATYRDVRPLDHLIPVDRDWKTDLASELIAKF